MRGSFWAAQRRRCHQRRTRSGGSAQAMEGPADRGRHRRQAAAAHAHQRRQRPRAHPQQLQQRRRRRQLQLPPAASPLAARGGSQCEPPDPGRLGPRSAGGCRRFNLQQPTLGRSAKGAHGPVGWQLAAAPLGCAPERPAARPGGGGARKRMRPHTDAGFGALSDERGAYLPAERPSAASSAARLAATQQQRCRASTAPASQRRPRHPPSRARQGATVDARRLKAATCFVRSGSS